MYENDRMPIRLSQPVLFMSVLAVLCAVLLATPASARKHAKLDQPHSKYIQILSHLNVSTAGFQDAYLSEDANGTRLYIQSAGSRQAESIDVSNPEKPKDSGLVSFPGDAKASQTQFDDYVAITTTGGAVAPKTPPQGQTVTLWDLTDPKNPQVALKFDGVFKAIRTRGDMLYIVDSKGLWIVQIYDRNILDWEADTQNLGS